MISYPISHHAYGRERTIVSSATPRVSVIVPNYNHASFLEDRLHSILSQSYKNFELIVLDDCSTDGSLDVIKRTLAHHEYHLQVNTTNSGSPFLQWAKGIEKATGEFIWIAESDDSAEPQLLERLLGSLSDPTVSLAYCQSTYIDTASNKVCSAKYWTDDLSESLWSGDFTVCGKFFNSTFLSVKSAIPNASAVVFRRDRCDLNALRNVQLKVCGDWLFWHWLAESGRVSHVAEPLNLFRSHTNNVRSRHGIHVLDEMINVSRTILLQDGGCPENQIQRKTLAEMLIRFWESFGFRLSAPATWMNHRKGLALIAALHRSRRALLWLCLRDVFRLGKR
jgi:glycosyltransferase involved in cell wall biosynthesis